MRFFYFLLVFISVSVRAQPVSSMKHSLDTLFESFFKSSEPGGAVLLAKDGKVIYQKGFGIAEINSIRSKVFELLKQNNWLD